MISFTIAAWLAVVAGSVVGGQSSSGLVVLDPSAAGALSMTGNSKVLIPAKVVYVNSSSAQAVKTVGTALLDAPYLYIVGGAAFGGQSACTGTVVQSTSAYADPLASRTFPSSAGMVVMGAQSLTGSGAVTLSPGYYSAGISVTGNTAVTLAPGVYLIGGSGLKVTSGSIVGEGVTLVMASGELSIGGTSMLKLSPPTTGDLAGVVIAQPKANTANMSLAGGSGVLISGAIYAPSATLSLVGNSLVEGEGPQMGDLVVAGKVSLRGTAMIKIGGPAAVAIDLAKDALYD